MYLICIDNDKIKQTICSGISLRCTKDRDIVRQYLKDGHEVYKLEGLPRVTSLEVIYEEKVVNDA